MTVAVDVVVADTEIDAKHELDQKKTSTGAETGTTTRKETY